MKFVLVTGYPGSGKTTWARKQSEKENASLMDDLKLRNIPYRLHDGDYFITNPNMCDRKFRERYIERLMELYPDSEIVMIFFENEPEICLKNAVEREMKKNGHTNNIELTFKRLVPLYKIPFGAVVMPVFKDEDEKVNDTCVAVLTKRFRDN